MFTAMKSWLRRLLGKPEEKTVQPVKIKKKLSRGKTAQEIAEDLEESLETVEELITQLSGTASP